MLIFMLSAGAASARMTAADAAAAITGRRWTTAAHRSRQAGPERLRPLSPRLFLRANLEGFASRVPVKPSRAGSRVSEPSQHAGDGRGRGDRDAVHQRLPQHQQAEHAR